MKKILSTAFAALALSMVVVSTVDAKRRQSQRSKSTPVLPSQRQVTKEIMADANAVKAAPMDEKQTKAMALANDLMANPELAELAQLQFERKKIGADLETAKAKLATIKTGWLFDSEDAKAQRVIVSKLNSQLRDKNIQIKSASKDLPRETSYAVYYGVAAVVGAIGVISALEYWYNGSEGYVGTAMTRTKTGLGSARKYVGEKATGLRNRASNYWYGNKEASMETNEPVMNEPEMLEPVGE